MDLQLILAKQKEKGLKSTVKRKTPTVDDYLKNPNEIRPYSEEVSNLNSERKNEKDKL